ncbi:MAG: hypothetical protein WAR39_04195, partial [Prevotella sp.]
WSCLLATEHQQGCIKHCCNKNKIVFHCLGFKILPISDLLIKSETNLSYNFVEMLDKRAKRLIIC